MSIKLYKNYSYESNNTLKGRIYIKPNYKKPEWP